MANPYQLSSIRTNLDSLRNIQGMDKQQTLVDTLMQKQKISEDYEKDINAIQKDARDRSKKHSGLLKGIKGIATVFGGPLANAIVGGITSGIQLKQQKSGAKMLQHKAMDRYSKNFLSQQADAFKEQADEAQLSSGDVLRGAFGGGLSSYLGSKMMGGEKDSSMFKKWKEGRQAADIVPQIEEGYGKYTEGFDKRFEDYLSEAIPGEQSLGKEDWLKMEKFLDKKGYASSMGFDPSMLNVDEDVLKSVIPGFENLYKSMEQGGDMSDVSEKLQGALKIPNLLQMLLGL
tara:strand:- start:972 stop:1835 length:864 start_codon:yes stop_codon:yes gene_type:complete